jgi:hypothetical protein
MIMGECPIHQRGLQVNPQSGCPFYSDFFPQEIRDYIFQRAVEEETSTNHLDAYPEKYSRPHYKAKKRVDISLLLTCRRIYLETYHLPVSAKEHVFWHAPETGPNYPNLHHDRFVHEIEDQYFTRRLQPWQLQLVKEVHLFTQMFWLEQAFNALCKEDYMQGIEKLKITIRRTDWWWNERNVNLYIDPRRRSTNPHQMRQDMAREREGSFVPWEMEGWGGAFTHLSGLKELDIEFETSDDKREELVAIVERAKGWKFPLRNGRALSSEGWEVRETNWQSPKNFWSAICPYCGSHRSCRPQPPTIAGCLAKMTALAIGHGPLCHIFHIKWQAVQETADPR